MGNFIILFTHIHHHIVTGYDYASACDVILKYMDTTERC